MAKVLQEVTVCDLCSGRGAVAALTFTYGGEPPREMDVCRACFSRVLPARSTRPASPASLRRRARRAEVYEPRPEEL
jgi:hypothetical protein